MTLPLLLDDALVASDSGFAVRISLPWIRSMPLASIGDLRVAIDGETVAVSVRIDGREVAPAELRLESGWWFIQDRLELRGRRALAEGPHDVSVSFSLSVHYLQAGPNGPLTLPFRADRRLAVTRGSELPDGWRLSASAFNWTPAVVRADRSATDIAVRIVDDGIADTIEIEPGQVWRTFPEPSDAEVDVLRERLAAAGGSVSIVGASLDDWALPARRRTEDERLAFLVPQLRAAARVGAIGARVPFGQAGPELLRRVQPVLEELGIVLFEEIQGQQTPDLPDVAANIELIEELGDPRIRILVDSSMLMPSLPPTYLDALRRGGVDEELASRLEHDWRARETHDAVVSTLREGRVPPAVHTLFMDLLVRFGRSEITDLEPLLPLTSGVHLKFWDLDDTGGRVSRPIADLGAALRRHGFAGTLTSEWGGHEWLDTDPAEMTRAHLALARRALSSVGGGR
jgi:sugar phosphate isomerase/epimerase